MIGREPGRKKMCSVHTHFGVVGPMLNVPLAGFVTSRVKRRNDTRKLWPESNVDNKLMSMEGKDARGVGVDTRHAKHKAEGQTSDDPPPFSKKQMENPSDYEAPRRGATDKRPWVRPREDHKASGSVDPFAPAHSRISTNRIPAVTLLCLRP